MIDSARLAAEKRVGLTIKGKYLVERVLGMGGMAVVYAVTHTRNNASLAIKMLHPELSYRDDIRSRFLREGYAANTVGHPGVVMVVDDDIADDGAVFLVMERLQGQGVEQLGDKLDVKAAVAIVDQLLDVLAAAHDKGIVHRDIKPANLFLTRDGTVKVLDFGIAKVRDALASVGGQMTSSGMLMGTPAFMSPEQALAKVGEIDARSDVWAAGATLYTLISGRFVHEAENAPQMLVKAATQPAPSLLSVAPKIPSPIVDVVGRALAQDRGARFATAGAMRAALREASQRAFGAPPSRDVLVALGSAIDPNAVATAPTQHVPVNEQRLLPQTGTLPVLSAPRPTPGPTRQHTGGTTAEPVSAQPPSVPVRSRTPFFVVGAALLVAAGLGVGAKVIFRPPSVVHDTSASVEPSFAIVAPSNAGVGTAVVTVPSAASSISAHDASVTAITTPPTVKPSSTAAPSARPSVTASTRPAASVAQPNCDTPYIIDDKGHRVYRPECLQ